jgi:hypothetical protein
MRQRLRLAAANERGDRDLCPTSKGEEKKREVREFEEDNGVDGHGADVAGYYDSGADDMGERSDNSFGRGDGEQPENTDSDSTDSEQSARRALSDDENMGDGDEDNNDDDNDDDDDDGGGDNDDGNGDENNDQLIGGAAGRVQRSELISVAQYGAEILRVSSKIVRITEQRKRSRLKGQMDPLTASLHMHSKEIKFMKLITDLKANNKASQKMLDYMQRDWHAHERVPRTMRTMKERLLRDVAPEVMFLPQRYKTHVIHPNRELYRSAPNFNVLVVDCLLMSAIHLLLEISPLALQSLHRLFMEFKKDVNERGERVYSTPNTGTWWEGAEKEIRRRLRDEAVCILALVLYIDGTLVDKAQLNEVIPVWLTLANFPLSEIKSTTGKVMVALFPVVKMQMLGGASTKEAGTDTGRRAETKRIKNECYNVLADRLIKAFDAALELGGIEIALGVSDVADSRLRIVKVVPCLCTMVMDTEEAWKFTGVRKLCTSCLVRRQMFNSSHFVASRMKPRLQEDMDAVLTQCLKYDLKRHANEAAKEAGTTFWLLEKSGRLLAWSFLLLVVRSRQLLQSVFIETSKV